MLEGRTTHERRNLGPQAVASRSPEAVCTFARPARAPGPRLGLKNSQGLCGGPFCPFLHLPTEKTTHGQTVCKCVSLDWNPGSPTLHAAGFMLGLQDLDSSPRFPSQPVCDPGQVI